MDNTGQDKFDQEAWEESELENIRKTYIIHSLIVIIVLIVYGAVAGAIFVFTITHDMNEILVRVIEALLIVIGLYIYYIVARKMNDSRNQFKSLYKFFLVKRLIKKSFFNSKYNAYSGFTKEEAELFGIVDKCDYIHAEDYLKAEYNGIIFEHSDVWVDKRDYEGHSVRAFSGMFMSFDYPEKNIYEMQLYSKRFSHRQYSTNQMMNFKVNMENVKFNKVCDVYTPEAQDAFYILTPQLMERLTGLFSRFSELAIHFYLGRVYVAYKKGNQDSFDTKSVFTKLSRKMEVEKIQQDIDDIKAIIEAVRGV